MNKCIICEHLDENKLSNEEDEKLFNGTVFDENNEHKFKFCYCHHIEFFQRGQYIFFNKYSKKILGKISSSDKPKFLELLKKYRKY